jgi:hypothetical protein
MNDTGLALRPTDTLLTPAMWRAPLCMDFFSVYGGFAACKGLLAKTVPCGPNSLNSTAFIC